MTASPPSRLHPVRRRTLEIVGDKWAFLILREAALRKVTRFADFRDGLGIAPDVLSNRLNILVDAEVMEKQPYREPGARTRYSYHLTPAGEQLLLVLAALQQWGDENRPPSTDMDLPSLRLDGEGRAVGCPGDRWRRQPRVRDDLLPRR